MFGADPSAPQLVLDDLDFHVDAEGGDLSQKLVDRRPALWIRHGIGLPGRNHDVGHFSPPRTVG
ncbi:MAG TPA: hypothetical protein VIJ34_06730 [Acidimicrobiales bacterium]